ncbi:hypothetical protein CF326_g8299 [Tilletia indica]|nr:hypothetical protein CF326_g8299 [Tilletia indica]
MKKMATSVDVREPLLHNAFGFVDGLNLRTYQPGDVDEQNAFYNGWLGDTYCSQVIAFLPDGEIAWVSYNNPGSWHDSKIVSGFYKFLKSSKHTPKKFALLADSAFPRGKDIQGHILSKPKEKKVMTETDVSKLRLWEAKNRRLADSYSNADE